jgi:hypothetical protein
MLFALSTTSFGSISVNLAFDNKFGEITNDKTFKFKKIKKLHFCEMSGIC